jgi:DNA-binding transcriptional regulator YiaG
MTQSKSRGFSSAFVQAVKAADPAHPGVKLAKLCIKHEISIAAVAAKLKVTRATMYNWAVGKFLPTPHHARLIEKLTARLSQA